MNSQLFQFRYSYERDVAEILMVVAIGAAGAPTLTNAKGVTSMVRNSAGNYTINLKDNFYLFLGAKMTNMLASGAAAAPLMKVVSQVVNSATAPAVVIECQNTSGVATDPANGEILLIQLSLRSAST